MGLFVPPKVTQAGVGIAPRAADKTGTYEIRNLKFTKDNLQNIQFGPWYFHIYIIELGFLSTLPSITLLSPPLLSPHAGTLIPSISHAGTLIHTSRGGWRAGAAGMALATAQQLARQWAWRLMDGLSRIVDGQFLLFFIFYLTN